MFKRDDLLLVKQPSRCICLSPGAKLPDEDDFRRLDQISVNQEIADQLIDSLVDSGRRTYDLLEKPALSEFELKISEPAPSNQCTYVRYVKTFQIPEENVTELGNGIFIRATPKIEAYISFGNYKDVDVIVSISSMIIKSNENSDTGTTHCPIFIKPDLGIDDSESVNIDFQYLIKNMKLLYLAIQEAIYDKPIVFKERSGNQKTAADLQRTAGKYVNKAYIRKVIYIDERELKNYLIGHRTIDCPCWGVVGHYRTLKNGKRIWIHPYRKGKKRNEPGAYKPKEYMMEES